MATEESRDKNQRVLEIEIARDGDHSTHEETITVLVVGSESNLRDAQTRAGQLVDEKRPGWLPEPIEGVTAQYCGSRSLDKADRRQFIDETQDDVIVGPEVLV